ncbi:FKBP-type peptidyl-prolyl cis-trans isomerase [Bacteroidota bacterium]
MRSRIYHRIPGLLALLLFALLLSCRQAPGEEQAPTLTAEEEKEMLLRVNKFMVQKDVELIKSYAERREWNMQVSETGLFYDIYEKTDGAAITEGMKVRLNYRLSLLDGTLCYSSEKDGIKEFIMGKSNEISGLEQGMELMRRGEMARFIIPPHLAFGLLGDDNMIPARSIIVYEVELLEEI